MAVSSKAGHGSFIKVRNALHRWPEIPRPQSCADVAAGAHPAPALFLGRKGSAITTEPRPLTFTAGTSAGPD
jgi:hypothetical protein